MTQVAFADLQSHIEAAGGNRDTAIRTFMDQNDGEGWLIPEALRLADYDLGHDDRAREHQPVASALGARFYDWQLVQPPEEAWAETHIHARNLLGEHGYRRLLAELDGRSVESAPAAPPLSEVAEDGHNRGHWFDGAGKDAQQSRTSRDSDQTDLFD